MRDAVKNRILAGCSGWTVESNQHHHIEIRHNDMLVASTATRVEPGRFIKFRGQLGDNGCAHVVVWDSLEANTPGAAPLVEFVSGEPEPAPFTFLGSTKMRVPENDPDAS